MGATDYQSTWDLIQTGVRETERLIGQKQYNLSMMKARQTLEIMVRCLSEKACIVESDMADSIDQLYELRRISKTTMEHYHKIRTIGNKAVHESDDSPYNANQAYHMLSQEVYTFANDYSAGRKKSSSGKSQQSRSSSGRPASSNHSSSSRRSSSSNRTSGSGRAHTHASGAHRKTSRNSRYSYDGLIRLCIPVVCVVLLIILIKILAPIFSFGKGKQPADTSAPTTIETTGSPETAPPETFPTAEPETPSVTYKTNTTLNVRTEPNTTCSIVTQLPPGTVVNYVGQHDDSWTIINYDGQDVYVSSQYLTTE